MRVSILNTSRNAVAPSLVRTADNSRTVWCISRHPCGISRRLCRPSLAQHSCAISRPHRGQLTHREIINKTAKNVDYRQVLC